MTGPSNEIVMYAARLIRQVRRELNLPAYVRVLSLLDELGPTGISQLAAADNCAQPTMSMQIRQLEGDGLVARSANPDDARVAMITLTSQGRTELAQVRRRLGEAVQARLGTVPAEDVAVAVTVLRTLTERDEA